MVQLIPQGLRRFVGREASPRLGTRDAAIVSVCAQKGGVGKTTTAVNLACALAAVHRLSVLLVDMDSQAHVASSLHRILHGDGSVTLSEILLGKRRDVMEIIQGTDVARLRVTPSDKGLNETESIIGARIGKEFLLRQALRVARTHFDVIVIDCPPNLGNLTLNALLASQHVLVPCDMSVLSLEGVHDLVETLETVGDRLGHHLELLGLLRTRVDRRNRQMYETIQRILRRDFAEVLLETQIPTNTALGKAQMGGQPVFDCAPESTGAVAYRLLADEVARRLGFPATCPMQQVS